MSLSDTFTGSAGNLTGHTSDSGHSWSAMTSSGNISLTGSGTVYSSSVANVSVYKSSFVPAGIPIDLTMVLGDFGNQNYAGVAFNIIGADVNTGSYYCVRFNGPLARQWEFFKIVAGTPSLDTTYGGAAATDTMSISVRASGGNNVITLTINGAPQTPITDSSSPLAAGGVGVWLYGDGSGSSGVNLNAMTAADATFAGSVSPASATLNIGATTTLAASGFTGGSVTWSSNHTNIATVNSGGVVTGIAHHQATPQTATITATGVSNPSETATATITVNAAVVTVTPNPATVPTSGNRQFFASVAGAVSQSVTWAVSGGGSINASTGYYTAPAGATGSITVTATSAADTSRTGTSAVTAAVGTDTILPVGQFGPLFTGASANWKFFNTSHSGVVGFTADNVVEQPTGSGDFSATYPLAVSPMGTIYWRDNSSTPTYAASVIQPATGSGTLARALPPFAPGPSYTGLSTVAYRLVSPDGSEFAAFTTTGVTEEISGSGIYAVSVSLSSAWTGYIEWRTDSGATVTARVEVQSMVSTSSGGGSVLGPGAVS